MCLFLFLNGMLTRREQRTLHGEVMDEKILDGGKKEGREERILFNFTGQMYPNLEIDPNETS